MKTEPKFSITGDQIQEIIQLSKLQGGSKHRQEDIYKLLDRVVANGPINPPELKKVIKPPEWLSQALNEGNGVYKP